MIRLESLILEKETGGKDTNQYIKDKHLKIKDLVVYSFKDEWPKAFEEIHEYIKQVIAPQL